MERQPFDNYEPNLFPRLTRVKDWLKSVAMAGARTELCLSEHIKDKQPELPFED